MTDKSGNTHLYFDVKGIRAVYSKAFQRLLRFPICFLPLSYVFFTQSSHKFPRKLHRSRRPEQHTSQLQGGKTHPEPELI